VRIVKSNSREWWLMEVSQVSRIIGPLLLILPFQRKSESCAAATRRHELLRALQYQSTPERFSLF
jgi:hypothetical protein